MADVNAPQGGMFVAVRQTAAALVAPQANTFVAYNIPTENMAASFAGVLVVANNAGVINVQQAFVFALVRGNIYNPKLRAWWFELDAHEIFVLNLGGEKTLCYDLTTEKWLWWSNPNDLHWRACCGTNWVQSGSVAFGHGSDVVVGDDSTGILWILDPMQGYDDPLGAVAREEGTPVPFPRVATGQILARGREFISCYEVYITCLPGNPAFTGAEITLEYSDDAGRSYVSAGSIVAEEGNFQQEIAWKSLGQIGAPGRLFRLTDNGVVRQIYDMSIANG